MRSNASPNVIYESREPHIFLQTSSKVLACKLERAFISRDTRQADEFVFELSSDGTDIIVPKEDHFSNGPPPATAAAHQELHSLVLAAQGVGRVFTAFKRAGVVKYAIGTAFFVAKNIIATAYHVTWEERGWKRVRSFFTTLCRVVVEDLELAIEKANIVIENEEITPTQDAAFATAGFCMVDFFPRPSDDVLRVAFANDRTASGAEWALRHDFAFAKCPFESRVFFVPRGILLPPNTPVALIGYAAELDWEEIEEAFIPTQRSIKKVFTSWDKKFVSPGLVGRTTPQITEHMANAESSTGGAVVMELNSASVQEPFSFVGIHIGSADLHCNIFLNTTHIAFQYEWAKYVLPALANSPPTNTQKIRDYINYILQKLQQDSKEAIFARQALNML